MLWSISQPWLSHIKPLVTVLTEHCHVRSWDRVYTRTSLALLGVLSVVLGLVAGYGLTMAIGLPFTSLEQTLPYILEGIGLDVIFILVKGEPSAATSHWQMLLYPWRIAARHVPYTPSKSLNDVAAAPMLRAQRADGTRSGTTRFA